jgi:hypothetical protein
MLMMNQPSFFALVADSADESKTTPEKPSSREFSPEEVRRTMLPFYAVSDTAVDTIVDLAPTVGASYLILTRVAFL